MVSIKREIAWKCWYEIIEKIKQTECYIKDGDLHIHHGCGGDFVDIIERYII